MIIKTKTHDIEVSSVVSTTINKDGKSYPALEFNFPGAISVDDLTALVSGEIIIGENAHEGYNTLGKIAVTIGKITSAEEERDNLANELSATKAEHEEYKNTVEVILPKLDDETALSVKSLFPTWEDCVELGTIITAEGYRFTHNGKLYKCKNANPTFQSDWVPGNGTEALYEVINETHAGTLDDPVPYEGNMALESGKYYIQDGVTYLCNRDTGNPVHNALSELVGIYVETVSE